MDTQYANILKIMIKIKEIVLIKETRKKFAAH